MYESTQTKGERREQARQKAKNGMRVTGKNMARTIAASQQKRLAAMEKRASKKRG